MKPHLLLFPGLLFGAGLVLSGMTDPSRVQAFLSPGEAWDPTLCWVMAGALGSYALGARLLGLGRGAGPEQPIDARLLLGAALFGVGWGISGFCPGPAWANLGRGVGELLYFLPAMLLGMWLAQLLAGADD